jgi:dipeptidyl aminopeptidase/acylaminoacyl peptidase
MMTTRHLRLGVFVLACLGLAPALPAAGRALQPEDWYQFEALSDLRISPDGASLVYLVTRYERDGDTVRAHLFGVPFAGGEPTQLTRGESASEPRFSPDGRWISFLSTRPAGAGTQLWVLDRQGGEARQVSHESGAIESYEWAPDSTHVVLVERPAAEGAEGARAPKPIVIDTLHFKEDRQDYLTAASHTHLVWLDVVSGTSSVLTPAGADSDALPAFSPDGKTLAFVRHGEGVADITRDHIELLTVAGGAVHELLAVASPNHQRLEWSPDGRRLALLVGNEPKYFAYINDQLALVDIASGRLRPLTAALDRAVLLTHFEDAGRSIVFAVEDDGRQGLARVDVASGTVTRLETPAVVHDLAVAGGRLAVLASDDHHPTAVAAVEATGLRRLTHHNDAFFAQIELGRVEDIAFRSADGTQVHGQLVTPPDYRPGQRYPTLVWIHGGPNGQDDHSLELWGYGPQLERQLFATHGYAVLAINYRGSSGRGFAFGRAIFADWGHKEVEDLRAGIDYLIARGVADPARLGVGGWSYGGILTDYLIASDPRLKAAMSGAGSANQLSMYGSDQYVNQYNAELGPPWQNPQLWQKVSYPFFHADRIHTPTLFMGGDRDFNVPIIGSEQMYQALRTLNVPTELVIYPGENHVFTRPSFLVDRWQRFLGWFAKYLPAAP